MDVNVTDETNASLIAASEVMFEAEVQFNAIRALCTGFDPSITEEMDPIDQVGHALLAAQRRAFTAASGLILRFDGVNSIPTGLFDVLGNYFAGAAQVEKSNQDCHLSGWNEGFNLGFDMENEAYIQGNKAYIQGNKAGYDEGFEQGVEYGENEGFDAGAEAEASLWQEEEPALIRKHSLIGLAVGSVCTAMLIGSSLLFHGFPFFH